MQWTVLGTSCMVPTKERNVAGHFLKFKGEGILFDCGEGTQRQMNICGIKRTDVTKVCITHWHGDHCSGLIGLIQTLGNEDDPPTLDIFGPTDSKERVHHMLSTCAFTQNVKLRVHEITLKDVQPIFEDEDYALFAGPLRHSIPCIGYAFVEKDRKNIDMEEMKRLSIKPGPHMARLKEGKTITWKGRSIQPHEIVTITPGVRIAYITDTRPAEAAVTLAHHADLLICEAVYTSDLQKNAERFRHLTAREAGQLASQANVKKLVLSHFSQRFTNTHAIEEEARTVFDNVTCAHDFTRFTL